MHVNPTYDLTQYTHPDLKDFKLRPEYQWPQHIATIDWARTNYGGKPITVMYNRKETTIPLLHPPAIIDNSVGAGKTVSIGATSKHVSERGGKVLVLSRKGEIIEQNSADAWAMGCRCSIFSASIGQKSTHYPAVMGTEGTVANALNTNFGYRHVDANGRTVFDGSGVKVPKWKPDAILIDECHEVDWVDLLKKFLDPEHVTSNQYTAILYHFITMNPKVRILGYTGSPFRNNESIIGGFWQNLLYEVSTMFLVELGYLVPPVFGFGDDDVNYDLSEWNPTAGNTDDYSSKDLQAMQRKITKDISKTQAVTEKFIEYTSGEGGVLITCAGLKHCEQVAQFLPDGSWGIIVDKTSTKERRRILAGAKDGSIKYVLQVGCLTTGINVPLWRYCVILRRIGSLTLLIQLIGRVLRTLTPAQIEAGLVKDNAYIFDFTDTMESMGDIYAENPIIEAAMVAKAKEDQRFEECPLCQTHNSIYAVRCVGASQNELVGRCGHFFQFSMCFACMTKNAPSAESCRGCGAQMRDHDDALRHKAYTDADYKPVLGMRFGETTTGGLSVTFILDSQRIESGVSKQEVAIEYYQPLSREKAHQGRWSAFLREHVRCQRMRNGVYSIRSVSELIKNKALFDIPTHITHRVNDKGFSIVNRRKFLSGRESE